MAWIRLRVQDPGNPGGRPADLPFASGVSLSPAMKPPHAIDGSDPTEFDFVIIGGGTAGLVLAKRLSAEHTVAVVEAGEYHPDEPLINIPGNFSRLQGNPTFDWSFQTAPQAGFSGNDQTGATVRFSQGKALGGSSAINYMGWVRGGKQDYDAWEELGNQGWNWESMLPYFQKIETVHEPTEKHVLPGTTLQAMKSAGPWGKDGPILTSHPTFISDIVPVFVETLNALGMRTNPNTYNGDPTGYESTQSTIDPKTGTRSYSGNAYYTLSTASPKLTIFTGTTATRINLDIERKSFRATGVDVTSNADTYTLTARKEVILSAGGFQSPKLLELSGIGDPDLLASHGIKNIIALPGVGENFQDHMCTFADWNLKPGYTTIDTFIHDKAFQQQQMTQYETDKTGMMASGLCGLGYTPLHVIAERIEGGVALLESVRKQAFDLASRNHALPLTRKQYEIQSRWLEDDVVGQVEFGGTGGGGLASTSTDPSKQYLTIMVSAPHPFSRGSVHITSSDPLAPPAIDPRYLCEQVDRDIHSLGLAFAGKLTQTALLGAAVSGPHSPSYDPESPARWLKYAETIPNGNGTLYHPIGTCAMAPKALAGVVDKDLTVYGTSNLRVVDASIIPLHITAHLVSTVYAIAERASDLILKAHDDSGMEYCQQVTFAGSPTRTTTKAGEVGMFAAIKDAGL